ncbi:hypothetical protein CG719_12075 [Streptomyces sp. CB01373]|nr:hypothetical protein CG719_12075 [Streptomyces sp. CB01373]
MGECQPEVLVLDVLGLSAGAASGVPPARRAWGSAGRRDGANVACRGPRKGPAHAGQRRHRALPLLPHSPDRPGHRRGRRPGPGPGPGTRQGRSPAHRLGRQSRGRHHRLREHGLDCIPLALDVTSKASIDAAFDTLEADGDSPDILVNNAGVSLRNSALEATPEEFDTTLSLKLRGTYFTAQRAARAMRRRGHGCIISLASIGGLVVDGERSSVYDASKAAVVHVTRNMAYEWGPHGIRVNSIAPDYMPTNMTSDLLPTPEAEERIVRDHIPLSRVGEPSDPSGAVVFLAAQASSYITGHTLTVDGGWTAAL